eukprot:7436577-Heterocapsa_arctica.AAC.1
MGLAGRGCSLNVRRNRPGFVGAVVVRALALGLRVLGDPEQADSVADSRRLRDPASVRVVFAVIVPL